MSPLGDAQALLLVGAALLPYALGALAGSGRALRMMVLAQGAGLGYLWWAVLSSLSGPALGPYLLMLALLSLGAISGALVRAMTLGLMGLGRLPARPWAEIAGALTLALLVVGLTRGG